jgi:hypothetical protein
MGQGKSQERSGELNIIKKQPRQRAFGRSVGCHFPRAFEDPVKFERHEGAMRPLGRWKVDKVENTSAPPQSGTRASDREVAKFKSPITPCPIRTGNSSGIKRISRFTAGAGEVRVHGICEQREPEGDTAFSLGKKSLAAHNLHI